MPARILVIEDNEESLELLTFLLTAYGHTALAARDGEEGLARARSELPDLVLSDLQMPKLDGYQVSRMLRQDPRFAKCPLIAVSSYAMRGDRELALKAGFDGYIPKPIVPQEFVGQVEKFLGIRRSAAPPTTASEEYVPEEIPYRATILAVDNSTVNLSLIESTLGPAGYRVIRATSAREAIESALSNPPDLILSDLHMPDEDGYQFFDRLRTEPKLRAIPFVIISSARLPESDLKHSRDMGVSNFIVRPIEPQQLVKRIEDSLGRDFDKAT